MGKLSCVFTPKIGKNLMGELRKQFGYETAKKAFLSGALNPKFIEDYRSSLKLDSEGVPTFESFMSIPYVQRVFIGKDKMLAALNNHQEVEDTINNYNALLQEAFTFNTKSVYRDSYMAEVSYTENNKLKVTVSEKTEKGVQKFQREYRQNLINHKLSEIFKPLGVTIGLLSKVETNAGKVGVTDFTIADRLSQDFVSMIRVANNREGAKAVSEEFAHLIIGALNDNPLIARSLQYIKNNPQLAKIILGDDYNDVVAIYNEDMDLVAEEALGHLLRDNLIENNTDKDSLFDRAIKNIRQQFKGYKEKTVVDALKEVNEAMATVAKSIFDESLPITRKKIIASRRKAQLNALSDRIARNIETLKKAKEVEIKRFRIANDQERKEFSEANVSLLSAPSTTELDTIITLTNYAKNALEEMESIFTRLNMVGQVGQKQAFSILRDAKSFVASYSKFITHVNQSLMLDAQDEDSLISTDSPQAIALKDTIEELAKMSRSLTDMYTLKAHKAFCDFLKPFLGDQVILKMTGNKGTEITVEELLNSAEKDISFFDRWLDAMGDSSDVLLQALDLVVKNTKDIARNKTIDSIREITALRQEAESKGITSFDWMFEKDSEGNLSGDYIRKVHYAEFNRQYKEMCAALDKKYGKIARGEDATKKIAERKQWLKENALSEYGTPIPKPEKWVNLEYQMLSADKKEILEKFIKLKQDLEKALPDNRVELFKAIQIRKDFSQRLIDSGMSPSTIFSNIKNYYAETFLDRIDDDQTFGQSFRGAMKDFEDHEYMVLPILYVNRLEDPNDLSTDAFGTLLQYAYMAHNYKAMDSVVDALETGRTIIKENRKTKTTRGSHPVIEKVKTKIGETTGQVFDDSSNINKKLDDFFESQVYGRYLKDSGSFELFGKSINANKLTSYVLSRSSFMQLGFNWLANTANALIGSCMQHIEAAAGQYFGAKELVAADAEYTKLMSSYIPELGVRLKQSELALFDEMIDFKGDFKSRLKGVQKKNILQRLFGENIAFMGQDAGDHWLYNRTAIAMAKRQRVIVPGKGEMSLWDAKEIVESEYGEGLKKMIIPEGTTYVDGKPFRITMWARQVKHVNHSLFGIYNEEDSNAASRVIMGRLLQQYRKWIKPQFNKRFQKAQQNLIMGNIEEGYYRTVLRICNELIRGHVQLSSLKDELTDEEKANVKRALFEIVQFLCVWAICNFVEWPDDEDRPWAIKLAEYSAKRLQHELGGLTPSLVMGQELLKNVKNPVPSVSVGFDMINLIGSLIDPRDWTDEMQSGPYKGKSTLEKHFLKAPIPGVRQYKQVSTMIDDIDTKIDYYARPY